MTTGIGTGIGYKRLVVDWGGGQETTLNEHYPVRQDEGLAISLAAACMPEYMKKRPEGYAPQPAMLLIMKAIGKLNTGQRDEDFEASVFKAVVRVHGLGGLARMFGQTDDKPMEE